MAFPPHSNPPTGRQASFSPGETEAQLAPEGQDRTGRWAVGDLQGPHRRLGKTGGWEGASRAEVVPPARPLALQGPVGDRRRSWFAFKNPTGVDCVTAPSWDLRQFTGVSGPPVSSSAKQVTPVSPQAVVRVHELPGCSASLLWAFPPALSCLSAQQPGGEVEAGVLPGQQAALLGSSTSSEGDSRGPAPSDQAATGPRFVLSPP